MKGICYISSQEGKCKVATYCDFIRCTPKRLYVDCVELSPLPGIVSILRVNGFAKAITSKTNGDCDDACGHYDWEGGQPKYIYIDA